MSRYNNGNVAGPSRRIRQSVNPPSNPSTSLLGSSPDFGDFASAPSTHSPQDLLGSFDEQPRYSLSPMRSAPQWMTGRPTHEPVNLMDEPPSPIDETRNALIGVNPSPSSNPSGGQTAPIHVQLPPRPDEMPADYSPPLRSPRRLSQRFSFSGPGSPPQVSGPDIIFHPTHITGQTGEKRGPSDTEHQPPGSAQSRLFNTINTAKLATKWRSTLDHHHPTSFSHQRGTSDSSSPTQSSTTALPIDVTHSTPFASNERLAGVYVPPSGAPGYAPQAVELRAPLPSNSEYTGTILIGRQQSTSEVLTGSLADSLRQHLPSRQRLSGKWTLLFSLDQHGASLATLYRLVENYAAGHRNAGNVLIVRDGSGHLFGSYVNEPIVKREGSYYGGGESFLFKVGSTAAQLKLFRWTGRNQYFVLCESDFMSFGGGSGTYGLVLDSSFTHNSSATCPTFDNEILSLEQPIQDTHAIKFDCIGLEIWGTQ